MNRFEELKNMILKAQEEEDYEALYDMEAHLHCEAVFAVIEGASQNAIDAICELLDMLEL